ncbi:MAG TPA: peptide-methionine (R)-S-oxide reductase MsrB [Sphingobium sp.]|nr:peptide-methionine (R)-S-oxide reductase MsrB [Sphingobium sp.]
MNRRHILKSSLAGAAALACWHLGVGEAAAYPFSLTDAEWRKRLSPLAYNVLRKQATEHPFTSPLNKEHRSGIFKCAGCGQNLFNAKTKFDSGTGWPSFYAPLPRAIATSRDFALVYPRTEVHCARCGGHLGHVFDDGPPPTGKRYCMNGVALSFSAA